MRSGCRGLAVFLSITVALALASSALAATAKKHTTSVACGTANGAGKLAVFAGSGATTQSGGRSVVHGSTQNYVQFTYTAPCAMSSGRLEITVPSGWTPPAFAPTLGCTTTTLGKVSVNGQTITVSGVTLKKGGQLAVVYGQLSSYGSSTEAIRCVFGDGATAPGSPGTSAFGAKASLGATAPLVPISPSPTITIL